MVGQEDSDEEAAAFPLLQKESTINSESPKLTVDSQSSRSRLLFTDFWPACLLAEEGFVNVQFERYDTLLPQANAWLRDHSSVALLKCETIEQRISSPEQLTQDTAKFDVPSVSKIVHIIKGLRLWYCPDISLVPLHRPRCHATQIGYRNIMPQCSDASEKHTAYQDLSSTYHVLNEEMLMDSPIEGRIVTVETVNVRLDRLSWEGPEVQVDQSCWLDQPYFHILYFTRVFYVFEGPAYEQIGAADFLPDFNSCEKLGPKYGEFSSIMDKVNTWLGKVKDIRLTNIQTLEAAFPGLENAEIANKNSNIRNRFVNYLFNDTKPLNIDKVNTSANFIPKADAGALVKFVRVSYVRPKYGLPPEGLYVPKGITQQTFIPAVVKRAAKKKDSEFEPLSFHWDSVKTWLSNNKYRVIAAEVLHHPAPLLLHRKDQGNSVLIKGYWVFPTDNQNHQPDSLQRIPLVQMLRIYFDGHNSDLKRTEPVTDKQQSEKQSCTIV